MSGITQTTVMHTGPDGACRLTAIITTTTNPERGHHHG